MGKKIAFVSLVLVMVLSFTACGGEDLPTAQEIVDGATQAQSDVETCRMDMDVNMDLAGEAAGESFEMTTVINTSGAVDIENSQMQMDMAMNMAMTGEEEIDVEMEIYLIGDMIYMMMDIPEIGPMWMKSEMPMGYWEEMNQIGPQIELLETAEVDVIGSEIVGGMDCYVVEITPDMEQLWEIVLQQTETAGGMPYIDIESLDEMFRSYSVKQWIAKDTYFFVKAEIEMAMELTPEDMGFPGEEGEVAIDMVITMLVYDYNQPVSIELPPGAEDAVEMPMGF